MSQAISVTDADWDQHVLQSDTPVLVDFWADWCVPCRTVSPVVEEIAAERAGSLKVVKLNIDDAPETTRKYGVMSVPTLMVFSGGQERKRMIGSRGKAQILDEMGEFLG
jgi:thioredoxin 1